MILGKMAPLFQYQQIGINQNHRAFGQFEATGQVSAAASQMEMKGIRLPSNLFLKRVLLRD